MACRDIAVGWQSLCELVRKHLLALTACDPTRQVTPSEVMSRGEMGDGTHKSHRDIIRPSEKYNDIALRITTPVVETQGGQNARKATRLLATLLARVAVLQALGVVGWRKKLMSMETFGARLRISLPFEYLQV